MDWVEGIAYKRAREFVNILASRCPSYYNNYDGYSKEVKILTYHYIGSSVINSYLQKKYRGLSEAWSSGESWEWAAVGSRDAVLGKCRAAVFRQFSYNRGWWNQMLEMKSRNWENSILEYNFNIFRDFYFGDINKNVGDEIYSMLR